MPVDCIKFRKTCRRSQNGLEYVRNRREGVNLANDVLVLFGIVCNQMYVLAVTFWHKECRGTPLSGFITGYYDSGGNVF